MESLATQPTEKKAEGSVNEPLQGNVLPLWSPRFWNGMTLGDYFQLLKTGKFKFSLTRFHSVVIAFFTSLFNTLFAAIQFIFYHRRIRRSKLRQPPVFVIGHFRTGTTMLLEYLARDEQFIYPTTYQCFAPRHFLVTQAWIPRLMKYLLPNRRPMDNMQAGFNRPQEDEFALLSLGGPTVYQRLAFPNQPTPFIESLCFDDGNSPVAQRWGKKLGWFYRAITLGSPKRLLIKSPVHTGRVARLAQMFPGAKFVHIVRNPLEIFPSIKNAWRVLELTQAFQTPPDKDSLDPFIYDTLNEMYRGYWQQCESLENNQICEVRYEDLVNNPTEQIKRIYDELGLDGFELANDAMRQKAESLGAYKRNQFSTPQKQKDLIAKNWAQYAERYGYDT